MSTLVLQEGLNEASVTHVVSAALKVQFCFVLYHFRQMPGLKLISWGQRVYKTFICCKKWQHNKCWRVQFDTSKTKPCHMRQRIIKDAQNHKNHFVFAANGQGGYNEVNYIIHSYTAAKMTKILTKSLWQQTGYFGVMDIRGHPLRVLEIINIFYPFLTFYGPNNWSVNQDNQLKMNWK